MAERYVSGRSGVPLIESSRSQCLHIVWDLCMAHTITGAKLGMMIIVIVC